MTKYWRIFLNFSASFNLPNLQINFPAKLHVASGKETQPCVWGVGGF